MRRTLYLLLYVAALAGCNKNSSNYLADAGTASIMSQPSVTTTNSQIISPTDIKQPGLNTSPASLNDSTVLDSTAFINQPPLRFFERTIALRFVLSPEYQSLNPTHDALVRSAYAQFLDRSGTAEERAPWVAMLDKGKSLNDFYTQFLASPEVIQVRVEETYQDILHRPSEPGGNAYWSKHIQRGLSFASLKASFLSSPEYTESHNDSGAFVNGLFSDLLGRSPSDSEQKYWTDQLNGGWMNRAEIVKQILRSTEFANQATNDYYVRFLGRASNSLERQSTVSSLMAFLNNTICTQSLSNCDGVNGGEFAGTRLSQQYGSIQNAATIPSSYSPVYGDYSKSNSIHFSLTSQATASRYTSAFWGDSITQWWLTVGKDTWNPLFGSRGAFDFGLSGDTTANLIWRISHGGYPGSAKNSVLLIGTNNLGAGQTPDMVTAGIAMTLVNLLKQNPGSKILLLAILPRTGIYGDYTSSIRATNASIAKFHDGISIFYADPSNLFLNSNGSVNLNLYLDGLHPNAAGYTRLGNFIRPILDSLPK